MTPTNRFAATLAAGALLLAGGVALATPVWGVQIVPQGKGLCDAQLISFVVSADAEDQLTLATTTDAVGTDPSAVGMWGGAWAASAAPQDWRATAAAADYVVAQAAYAAAEAAFEAHPDVVPIVAERGALELELAAFTAAHGDWPYTDPAVADAHQQIVDAYDNVATQIADLQLTHFPDRLALASAVGDAFQAYDPSPHADATIALLSPATTVVDGDIVVVDGCIVSALAVTGECETVTVDLATLPSPSPGIAPSLAVPTAGGVDLPVVDAERDLYALSVAGCPVDLPEVMG